MRTFSKRVTPGGVEPGATCARLAWQSPIESAANAKDSLPVNFNISAVRRPNDVFIHLSEMICGSAPCF
jgi:hypothetical protein